jgi:hypothetical protein
MNEIEQDRIEEIRRLHNEIFNSLKMSLEKAIRVGQLLTEQKENLKHGEFTAWVTSNLSFTDRTARNYMKVYRERNKFKTETVSDLTGAYRLLIEREPKDEVVGSEEKDSERSSKSKIDWLKLNSINKTWKELSRKDRKNFLRMILNRAEDRLRRFRAKHQREFTEEEELIYDDMDQRTKDLIEKFGSYYNEVPQYHRTKGMKSKGIDARPSTRGVPVPPTPKTIEMEKNADGTYGAKIAPRKNEVSRRMETA